MFYVINEIFTSHSWYLKLQKHTLNENGEQKIKKQKNDGLGSAFKGNT